MVLSKCADARRVAQRPLSRCRVHFCVWKVDTKRTKSYSSLPKLWRRKNRTPGTSGSGMKVGRRLSALLFPLPYLTLRDLTSSRLPYRGSVGRWKVRREAMSGLEISSELKVLNVPLGQAIYATKTRRAKAPRAGESSLGPHATHMATQRYRIRPY